MTISNSRRRQKGAEGEAFILIMLQQIMAEEYIKRGLPAPELYRGANGRDIRGISFLSPEVKRHEPTTGNVDISSTQIAMWWEQTKRQCGPGQAPALFYRKNHSDWRVRMNGYIEIDTTSRARLSSPVEIGLEEFKLWFRAKVQHALAHVAIVA